MQRASGQLPGSHRLHEAAADTAAKLSVGEKGCVFPGQVRFRTAAARLSGPTFTSDPKGTKWLLVHGGDARSAGLQGGGTGGAPERERGCPSTRGENTSPSRGCEGGHMLQRDGGDREGREQNP